MKTYDLTPLKRNDEEYAKMAKDVSKLYKCDWDDKVHDSYLEYVNQVQEYSEKLHVIRCKAEMLVKEIEDMIIEEMTKSAQSLCREADLI